MDNITYSSVDEKIEYVLLIKTKKIAEQYIKYSFVFNKKCRYYYYDDNDDVRLCTEKP